jgi:hypothetical protein
MIVGRENPSANFKLRLKGKAQQLTSQRLLPYLVVAPLSTSPPDPSVKHPSIYLPDYQSQSVKSSHPTTNMNVPKFADREKALEDEYIRKRECV